MCKIPYFQFYAENYLAYSRVLTAEQIKDLMDYMSDLCLFGKSNVVLTEDAQMELVKAFSKGFSEYKASVNNGKKGGAPMGNQNAKKQPKNNPEHNPEYNPENNQPRTQNPEPRTQNLEPNIHTSSRCSDVCVPPPEKKFKKPTVDEVEAYCRERQNNVDAGKFWDFYEAKGWKVGKSPMKDWRSAVRTWEREDVRKPVERVFSGRGVAFAQPITDEMRRAWLEGRI